MLMGRKHERIPFKKQERERALSHMSDELDIEAADTKTKMFGRELNKIRSKKLRDMLCHEPL